MRRQNETFRRLARAPFGELLDAAVRDPALLLCLDAPANRKGHPNENLARELMELFTLGIGHYTEADVKEAARALTGWTVEDGAFREVAREARRRREDDPRPRRAAGRGADLAGDPARPARDGPAAGLAALRPSMGEGAVDEPAIDALADDLRANRLDVGRAVETVLRSRAFFAAANLGSRVVGPVEFVVGACRALVPAGSTAEHAGAGRLDGPARARTCSIRPTSAAGRAAGPGSTARSLVGRANFAAALVEGRAVGLPGAARRPDRR